MASPDLPGWYPLGGSGRRSSLGHDAPHTPVASWQIPAVADRSAGRARLHPPKGSALAAPVTGLAAAPIPSPCRIHRPAGSFRASSGHSLSMTARISSEITLSSISSTYLRPQVRRRHDLSSLCGE